MDPITKINLHDVPMPTNHEDDIQTIVSSVSDLESRLSREHLGVFLHELVTWNPRLGLVSKRETPSVIVHLIRQCIDMWDFVEDHVERNLFAAPFRIVDVGSGGGFPGIIWKLLEPDLHLTLVERKNRRAFFLGRVVEQLDMSDVDVVTADVKEGQTSRLAPFDLAALLAVAPPAKLGNQIEALLKTGGYLISVRSSNEVIEETVGSSLHLHQKTRKPDGTFLLYQKR